MPDKPTWDVYFSGSPLMLRELPRLFQSGALQFHPDGEALVLRSPEFDGMDSDSVRMQAQRFIDAISGIARILVGGSETLKISHLARIEANGSRTTFLLAEPAVISVTISPVTLTVTRRDGTIEERGPLHSAPAWLEKAVNDPVVAKALRLRDDAGLSWPDLYRLFEVIEAGVGGTKTFVSRGWTSAREIRRFKHSANSVAAAGDNARHGVEQGAAPVDPMSLGEARAYIDGLLQRWLSE